MVIGRKTLKGVRYRILVLLLVPLFSLVTSFAPMFTQNASAITYDDILNKARAWSILNAVIDNLSYVDSDISMTDVNQCDIMGDDDNDGIWVGSHATGQNGSDSATWEDLEDNTSILNNALSAVGIQGGCRGLLEAVGYTYNDGDMEGDFDDGDRGVIDRLNDKLNADAFFDRHLGDDNPGPAISYAILYYYLKNVCGWSYRNPFVKDDKANTTEGQRNREAQSNGWNGDTNDSHYHTYTYENSNQKAGDNTYFAAGSGTDGDVFVGSKSGFASSGANDATIDCADNNGDTIPAKLADNHYFADAYAKLVRPGSDTTKGTCGERFNKDYSDDAELVKRLLAACDEGYKNRTVDGFCEDKYPLGGVPDEHRACAYGHDDATGGANDTTPPPQDDEDKPTDETSCAIVGIGWIICPVVNFLAGIVDGAYAFVASMLTVQPLTTGPGGADEAQGIYTAWEVMRNFANICFILAFLVIVFSQITSVGITNYGIKKMLPRLVVAAILVNVSYWICAIAVDLSNIFGVSLKNLFDSISAQLILPNFNEFGATAEGWTGITGAILAGAAVTTVALFVQLTALLPVLTVVLFAIVTVFIVLMLRQAIIILLIVISPLAFVAFLLPNTEGLFKKWRQMFQVMLLMFPIISLIFGASALASKIVMGTAHGPYAIVIQIMGAGISIVPLFITPIVMKVSGGVLNRVGGVINNPNKGPFDRARKGAENVAERERNRRRKRAMESTGRLNSLPGRLGRISGSSTRRQARRNAETAALDRNAKRAEEQYIADQIQNNPAFAARVAGGNKLTGSAPDQDALARALAAAVEVNVKAEVEEVKAASAIIERGNFDQATLRTMANGGGQAAGNVALQRAAIQSMVASNDVRGINDMIDQSKNWAPGEEGDKLRKTLADSLAASNSRPAWIGQGAIAEIRNNTNAAGRSSQKLMETAVENNTYSPEKLAKADKDELAELMHAVTTSTTLDPQDVAKLRNNANTALTDSRVSNTIGKNRANVESVRSGTAPPRPT